MNEIAILTGDMVGSKSLTSKERDNLIETISSIATLLSPISKCTVEIFRGDSFQIKIEDVKESLRAAIAIRALFRSITFVESIKQWDCRLALGIGTNDFEKDSLATSDGEAYRFSGYGLERMKNERIVITTPWTDLNKEFEVETAFADDIISKWTVKQSKIMFQKLRFDISHTELASISMTNRQNIDWLLKAAKERLIGLFLRRFNECISDRLL